MTSFTDKPDWLNSDYVAPVVVTFVGLFAITWGFDWGFARMGINPAATLFNNFSIGYFGAGIVIYYQIRAYRNQKLARADEKARIFAEFQECVREELREIEESASVDNREERMRRTDEAAHRIAGCLENFRPGFSEHNARVSREYRN